MKPEWCTQEFWELATNLEMDVAVNHGGEFPAPILAKALLDAHQRGRRDELAEVYPLLERLRSWIEDEVYAELPFTAKEQVAFDAIQAKAQEVKT